MGSTFFLKPGDVLNVCVKNDLGESANYDMIVNENAIQLQRRAFKRIKKHSRDNHRIGETVST